MQIHVTSWRAIFGIVAVLVVFACGVERSSAQPKNGAAPALHPVLRLTEPESQLDITEKFARRVELENRITTVYGFDPQVVKVEPVPKKPNQIHLTAVAPGVTTVVLLDENDQKFELEVFVTGDVRHLQAYIRKLFPKSSVEVVAMPSTTDASVLLRGIVTQPEHINEIHDVAQQFYPNVINQMQLGGPQQVLMRVKVMEVQRSKIRRLGLNFLYLNEDGFLSSTPGSLTPLSALSLPFGGPAGADLFLNPRDTSAAFGIVKDDQNFQGFLDALKQERLLKILAEPELVTTSGRPANMLAGGSFPILVPQGLGTVTIEWRDFGVELEAVPIILGNGRVRLELQPKVSERDFTVAVESGGTIVPGVTERRVNTQVEMNFGETFIIAGLLSSQQDANTQKIPFFGELPWIGAAFRRVNYEQDETELVIMVTPELAGPLAPGQVPPGGPGLFTDAPTDRELFRDGLLEVPSYGDRCIGCDIPGPSVIQPYSSPWSPKTGPGQRKTGVPYSVPPDSVPPADREEPRIEPGASPSQSEAGLLPPVPSGGESDGQDANPDADSDQSVRSFLQSPSNWLKPTSSKGPGSASEPNPASAKPKASRTQSGSKPLNAPKSSGPKGVGRWWNSSRTGSTSDETFQPSRFHAHAPKPSKPSQPGLIEPKPGLIAPTDNSKE